MKLEGIEWQVSNRELSQRLKELGVEQDSLLHWWKTDNGKWEIDDYTVNESFGNPSICFPEDWASAFTVAELGEILPITIDLSLKKESGLLSQTLMVLVMGKNFNGHYIGYRNEEFFRLNLSETSSTEANARAKMLIYLIENKLMGET